MLVRYILSSVCLKLSQFSHLSFIQYMGLCVISLLIYLMITCTLSYNHHQIRSVTHLPLFRVRSWNNGMCCMSFYILEYFFSKWTKDWLFFFVRSEESKLYPRETWQSTTLCYWQGHILTATWSACYGHCRSITSLWRIFLLSLPRQYTGEKITWFAGAPVEWTIILW